MSAETFVEACELRRRAELHKPNDPAALAAEARRMANQGLSDRDVAAALRLPVDFVQAALRGAA